MLSKLGGGPRTVGRDAGCWARRAGWGAEPGEARRPAGQESSTSPEAAVPGMRITRPGLLRRASPGTGWRCCAVPRFLRSARQPRGTNARLPAGRGALPDGYRLLDRDVDHAAPFGP